VLSLYDYYPLEVYLLPLWERNNSTSHAFSQHRLETLSEQSRSFPCAENEDPSTQRNALGLIWRLHYETIVIKLYNSLDEVTWSDGVHRGGEKSLESRAIFFRQHVAPFRSGYGSALLSMIGGRGREGLWI
jgi:hypothetical protein